MKERGLVIWFILMIALFGIVFSFESEITGFERATGKIVGEECSWENEFVGECPDNCGLLKSLEGYYTCDCSGFSIIGASRCRVTCSGTCPDNKPHCTNDGCKECLSNDECTEDNKPICDSSQKLCRFCNEHDGDGDGKSDDCSANYPGLPYCVAEGSNLGACVKCVLISGISYGCGNNEFCENNICNFEGKLIAHYKFESGATDSSDFNNDGTINGDANYVDSDIDGEALSVDGNGDYVFIGDNNSLAMEDKDFTFSAWIYPFAIVGSGWNGVFGGMQGAASLGLSKGNLKLTKVDKVDAPSSDFLVKQGEWSYVGVSFNSSSPVNNLRYYVNGENVKTVSFNYDFDAGKLTNVIGARKGTSSGNFFNGKIDEVKIHNYILSDSDIKTGYESNKPSFRGKIFGTSLNSSSSSGLVVYVDGSISHPGSYSGFEEININKSGKTLVEFNHDFSKYDLNLSEIYVIYRTSGNYGWVLVKDEAEQIKEDKTFYVQRVSKTNYVCIEDSDNIGSYSDVSYNCEGSSERLVECDGKSYSGYKCSLDGDYYKVEGLEHSAVAELRCNESWSCGNWGACSSGYEHRNCTDSKHCNTTLHKPDIKQSCVAGNGGGNGADDDFTDYGGEDDSGDGLGAGDGLDDGGDLGFDGDTGERIKQSKKGISLKYILLGAVVIVWIVIMIWIFVLRKRKKTVADEMFKEEEQPKGGVLKTESRGKKEEISEAPSAPEKGEVKKAEEKKEVNDELPW